MVRLTDIQFRHFGSLVMARVVYIEENRYRLIQAFKSPLLVTGGYFAAYGSSLATWPVRINL